MEFCSNTVLFLLFMHNLGELLKHWKEGIYSVHPRDGEETYVVPHTTGFSLRQRGPPCAEKAIGDKPEAAPAPCWMKPLQV